MMRSALVYARMRPAVREDTCIGSERRRSVEKSEISRRRRKRLELRPVHCDKSELSSTESVRLLRAFQGFRNIVAIFSNFVHSLLLSFPTASRERFDELPKI